jgi:hypothetical protein
VEGGESGVSLRAMLAVFERSESTLATRLVALALADNAHDDGSNAFPSLATLARKAKTSKSTVQRSLGWLEKECEIVETGRTKHGVRVWHFTLVQPYAEPLGGTQDRHGGYRSTQIEPLIENPQLIGSFGSQFDYPPIETWIDDHAADPHVGDVDFFSQLNVRRVRRGSEEHDRAVRRWIEARKHEGRR